MTTWLWRGWISAFRGGSNPERFLQIRILSRREPRDMRRLEDTGGCRRSMLPSRMRLSRSPSGPRTPFGSPSWSARRTGVLRPDVLLDDSACRRAADCPHPRGFACCEESVVTTVEAHQPPGGGIRVKAGLSSQPPNQNHDPGVLTQSFCPLVRFRSCEEREPVALLGQSPEGVSRGPKVAGRSRARSHPPGSSESQGRVSAGTLPCSSSSSS
jgi:hypothetical protein